jgi:hypothetical protein
MTNKNISKLTDEFITACKEFFDQIDSIYDETVRLNKDNDRTMTREEAKYLVNKAIDQMVRTQLKKMPTAAHKRWLASIMEMTRKT